MSYTIQAEVVTEAGPAGWPVVRFTCPDQTTLVDFVEWLEYEPEALDFTGPGAATGVEVDWATDEPTDTLMTAQQAIDEFQATR
jgi:hypothetical protein